MTRTVGIVLFPAVEELDFVGPLEALGAMAFIDRGWQVVTIAEAGGSVRARHGLSVNVDPPFADAPPLAVLLVPGGQGTRQEVDNPRMIDFVRGAGANAQYVTSVCTGAFILHRAGFLSRRGAPPHCGAGRAAC